MIPSGNHICYNLAFSSKAFVSCKPKKKNPTNLSTFGLSISSLGILALTLCSRQVSSAHLMNSFVFIIICILVMVLLEYEEYEGQSLCLLSSV